MPRFTLADLRDIEIAVRMRMEAADDDDAKEQRRWRKVHDKVRAALDARR